MIKQETAEKIAITYKEIEQSKKLISEIGEEEQKNDIEYNRGKLVRRVRKCELGWPSFPGSSTRIFQVDQIIAVSVIKAHIANQEAKLKKLQEIARLELLEDEDSE